MAEKLCIQCGKPREIGRQMCRECYLTFNAERTKKRYVINGRHNYGIGHCVTCGKEIKLYRREQLWCINCANNSTSKYDNVSNLYEVKHKTSNHTHRNIIEEKLQRKLDYNEVIHHLDEEPTNNNFNNLIVIGRGDHARLHRHLRKEQVLNLNFEQDKINISLNWIKNNDIKVLTFS